MTPPPPFFDPPSPHAYGSAVTLSTEGGAPVGAVLPLPWSNRAPSPADFTGRAVFPLDEGGGSSGLGDAASGGQAGGGRPDGSIDPVASLGHGDVRASGGTVGSFADASRAAAAPGWSPEQLLDRWMRSTTPEGSVYSALEPGLLFREERTMGDPATPTSSSLWNYRLLGDAQPFPRLRPGQQVGGDLSVFKESFREAVAPSLARTRMLNVLHAASNSLVTSAPVNEVGRMTPEARAAVLALLTARAPGTDSLDALTGLCGALCTLRRSTGEMSDEELATHERALAQAAVSPVRRTRHSPAPTCRPARSARSPTRRTRATWRASGTCAGPTECPVPTRTWRRC